MAGSDDKRSVGDGAVVLYSATGVQLPLGNDGRDGRSRQTTRAWGGPSYTEALCHVLETLDQLRTDFADLRQCAADQREATAGGQDDCIDEDRMGQDGTTEPFRRQSKKKEVPRPMLKDFYERAMLRKTRLNKAERWASWEMQLRIHLGTIGIASVRDALDYGPETQQAVVFLICMSVADRIQHPVLERKTLGEVWDYLEANYAPLDDFTQALQAQRAYYGMTWRAHERAEAFLGRLERARGDYERYICKVPAKAKTTQLLAQIDERRPDLFPAIQSKMRHSWQHLSEEEVFRRMKEETASWDHGKPSCRPRGRPH